MNGVTLKIGSKFDNKGVKQAQSGINNISKTFAGLKKAIGGLAVVAVAKQLKKMSDETSDGFRKQNAELVKLNQALLNNSKLSKEARSNIVAMTGSVSKMFDGDVVANATALASNMGLSEKQIRDVLSAAQDLAASGVMPLDQAVNVLSQSYSGQVGQLGKLLPETKKLTKEQLKNGDAVKLVANQYKGLADEMENTFAGRQTVFENSMGDLKNSIGGIFASLSYEAQGALIPLVNKITGWIEENRQKIINIFLHLPDIAKIAFNTIGQLIGKTFSVDGFVNLFTLIGSLLVNSMQQSFKIVWSLIQDVVLNALKFVWEAIQNIGIFFNNMFTGVGNKVIEVLNTIIQKAMQQPAIKWLYEKLSGNSASDVKIDFTFEKKSYNDLKKSAEDIFSGVKNFAKTYKDAVVEGTKGQVAALKNFGQFYGDITGDMVDKMSEVINQDLPSNLAHAFEAATADFVAKTEGSTGNSSGVNTNLGKGVDTINSLLGAFGQLGQLIQGIMSSNWIGLLIQLIAALVSDMSEKSESFGRFLNIFDEFANAVNNSGIVEAFDTIFAPLLDVVLELGTMVGQILLPIFRIIASVLGPIGDVLYYIIEALQPIIDFISEFLEEFNVLSPVMNWLVIGLKYLANVINWVSTAIYNAYVFIYNMVHWKNQKSYKSFKNISDMSSSRPSASSSSSTSTSDSSSSSTKTNSASYTAAKDIYVNIYYNNSYVNGDAEAIAVNLAKEIRRAESMNRI